MSRNCGVHTSPASGSKRLASSAIAALTSCSSAPSLTSAGQLLVTSTVAGKRECQASGMSRRADEPGVVGDQHREAGPGGDGAALGGQVQRQAAVERRR